MSVQVLCEGCVKSKPLVKKKSSKASKKTKNTSTDKIKNKQKNVSEDKILVDK